MTEPTQDASIDYQKFHEAFKWMREATDEKIADEAAYAAVLYTDYITISLQRRVFDLQARIATLEAELAARDFVPVTDEHKDGDDWPLACITRMQGHWTDSWGWVNLDGVKIYPTHAAPLPKPPAKEGDHGTST